MSGNRETGEHSENRSLSLHKQEDAAMEMSRNSFLQRCLLRAPSSRSSSGEWTLPSVLRQGKGGLTNVSVEELHACLGPILAGLEELDPEALMYLERVQSGGAQLRDGVQVRPIHDKINPRNPNVVRYIHLSKVPDQYSMGIFVFPPHAKIPLHDHPGMCVLSKVLYGDIQRLSLDLPRQIPPSLAKKSHPENTKSWLPWGSHRQAEPGQLSYAEEDSVAAMPRLAYRNRVDHLKAPECTVLYPFEGNLHEFVAGPNGAAVLDVLLPPYDMDQNRDCTFYYIQDFTHEELQLLSDDVPPEIETGRPCWIVPTGQPEDFHCISGTYRDLGE